MEKNQAETETNTIKSKDLVETVEKTAPPEGMPGDNWHRYVIGRGNSKIECKKPGTLKAVTQHAETIAENLNSRKARGGSMYVYGKQR